MAETGAAPPLLSVIATARSMARVGDVFDLLDSLAVQRYQPLETIFVAEASRELFDCAAAYVSGRGLKGARVLFNDGEPGLSAGRNVGIEAAAGEIIAFLDDDTVAFPDWAGEIVNACSGDSVVGVTGATCPLWDDPSMAWLPPELYWLISCTGWTGWDKPVEMRNAWGHNMAFRREAFRLCGLFDNRHGYQKGPFGEDNEFSLRARAKTGKRIVFSPRARVWHKVHPYRLSLRFVADRSFFIGRSRRQLRRACRQSGEHVRPLAPEMSLLGRIFSRLLPRIAGTLPRRPAVAGRQLLLTATSLGFLSLGFLSDYLGQHRHRASAVSGR